MNKPLPPSIKSADEPITLRQLAEAIGPRRAGRPTHVETVRHWCLIGVVGQKLESWTEVLTRFTTWNNFVRFCAAVEYAKTETRRQRKDAARGLGRRAEKKSQRAQQEAAKKLQALGCR